MEPEQTPAIPAVPAIRVFISCPGDLGPQRAIVAQAIESLNNDPEFAGRVRMVAYAYENMTPARVGMDAQHVVNSYMLRPEEAELCICMFWQRMGTPMERFINPSTGLGYQSGTEYEFLTAYDSFQRLGTPVMLLYRSHALAPPVPADPTEAVERTAQLARVDGFFARFAPGGDLKGMVGYFESDAELECIIRRDVAQTLRTDLMPLLERRARAQTGATAGTPVFFGLPPLTSDFVARPEAMDALRRALLGSRSSVGAVAAAALYGMGGLGKTTLARAACDDPAIRTAFPDGVLWATLGQQPDLPRLQREWIQALGGDVMAAISHESARAEIARLLARRTMLLVVDDVWNAPDATALLVDAPTCRALITTRDASQVEDVAVVPLDLMGRDECREILRTASRGRVSDPAMQDGIAARLDHLPLALRIIGSLLKKDITWSEIEAALDAGELHEMRDGQHNLFQVMEASVHFLCEADRCRYHELAIFPDDEPLSTGAVARLWARTGGVSVFGSKRLLAEFRDRSLILQGNTLHDLQVDYLRVTTTEDQRRALHAALCDTYGLTDQGEAFALPDKEDDSYSWRRLAWHAIRAGRHTALERLLTNATYLEGKLARLGVIATLDDFALAPGDEDIMKVSSAMRAGVVVLTKESSELLNQISGRVGSVARLHNLPMRDTPWLRLRTQSLRADPALQRILHVTESQTATVSGCTLTVDGQIAIAEYSDQTVRLWSTATGQMLGVWSNSATFVTSQLRSADGQVALTMTDEWALRLWDTPSKKMLRSLTIPVESEEFCSLSYGDCFEHCALSADGQWALAALVDGRLVLWNAISGRIFSTCGGRGDNDYTHVTACALSEHGRWAISGSDDGRLEIWDLSKGTERVLTGHTSTVTACALSSDGRWAISASTDGTVRLWDTTTQQSHEPKTWHGEAVWECGLSADGQRALTLSSDKTLLLWDATSGKVMDGLGSRLYGGDPDNGIMSFALSADGSMVFCSSWDDFRSRDFFPNLGPSVWRWDIANEQQPEILGSHWVAACAVSADGRFALCVPQDMKAHDTDDPEMTLLLWDMASGELIRAMTAPTASESVDTCILSADGQQALCISGDGTLNYWNTANGEMTRTLRGQPDAVSGYALSADWQLALCITDDRALRLWRVSSGQTLTVLRGHTSAVTGCALSANGKLALSASNDQTLRLWNTETGQELARWTHDTGLSCCALSADGRLAIVGDSQGGVHFLEVMNMTSAEMLPALRPSMD